MGSIGRLGNGTGCGRRRFFAGSGGAIGASLFGILSACTQAEPEETQSAEVPGSEVISQPLVAADGGAPDATTRGGFEPVLEWSWTSSAVVPDALNVMTPPAIADLDGDGTPEVIFGSTASKDGVSVTPGVLRALRGKTGAELFTVTDSALRINTAAAIAVGDIDADGVVDIVAQDDVARHLIAFTNTGALKWRSPVLEEAGGSGSPEIANILGGPAPEILLGRQVLDGATGALLWTGTAGRSGNGIWPHSIVADLNLDGSPEVVAGNTAYTATGAVLWTHPELTDGYDAVGNFDSDPFGEVVMVALGNLYMFEHDGTLKWGPTPLPHGPAGGRTTEGGPPTIADFDGDGQPEIGVADSDRFAVFETDGSLKWATATWDGSSYHTGASAFDFDGDGAAEAIYRDQAMLHVFGGKDGATLFEMFSSSCTWTEYPVVADVDADGHAEIISPANDSCGYGPDHGIFVYGDKRNRWPAARKIWNQYSYHVTNVNDDGSIPVVEANSWAQSAPNTYRAQSSTDCGPPACSAPPSLTLECNVTGGVRATDHAVNAFLSAAKTSTNCGCGVRITHSAPSFFPLGTSQVTWTAVDAAGRTSTCSSSVTVKDTTPPEVSTDIDNCCLDPHHDTLAPVGHYQVKDLCDPKATETADVKVTSDEPTGSRECPDAVAKHGYIFLRAEAGEGHAKGNGRVYDLTITARDASGNVTEKQVAERRCRGCEGAVCVPPTHSPYECHSFGRTSCEAVDDGQSYDATKCETPSPPPPHHHHW